MDAATMTHGLLEWVRYEQWLVAVYPVLALHKINNVFVIQIELMSLESFVFDVYMRVTMYSLSDATLFLTVLLPVLAHICRWPPFICPSPTQHLRS